MKIYEITYNNVDKIRTMIRQKHGVSVNKSQALNMAVDSMIKILVAKNNNKDNDNK